MRQACALAAGLLALAAAACVPLPDPRETGAVVTDKGQPAPVATAVPLRENVALQGSGVASTRDEHGELAVDTEMIRRALDGDPDTFWNSHQFAPQWFSVQLDDFYLVDRIQLTVTQSPAGPTTHEVWLRDVTGVATLHKRFRNVYTEDGQTLDVQVDPPRNLNEVFVFTVQSPSWVAWREVNVFGTLSGHADGEENRARVELVPAAAGLERPVQVTHAGDGSGRLFVVEQKGRIRILRDGVINELPFLDISGQVSCCGEQGLLNVAFPPEYAVKRHFYVSYTDVDGHTVISRFITLADSDRADPESEEVLLVIEQPERSHNGGALAFGPQDGYLYIGSGDGGRPGRHAERAQDLSNLLGKILRIDVESGARPYGIPPSNPFTGNDGIRDEIWAYGLRNPWGFSFDKETGALYIPDAGHASREEVNFQPASSAGGENYGWYAMEGNRCFESTSLPCRAAEYTMPIATYSRPMGCVVVGGAVSRGTRAPHLRGVFVYADFCNGMVWALERPDPDVEGAWQNRLLFDAPFPVSSIGEDEEGNVYVVGYGDGSIYLMSEGQLAEGGTPRSKRAQAYCQQCRQAISWSD